MPKASADRCSSQYNIMNVRINKFLADHGIASRRAIDNLIMERRVTVNGEILEKPGRLISDDDRVAVDGKEIVRKAKNSVFILFNKPLNCITTVKDTHRRRTVLDYVQIDARVFPVGRLDMNTTGALILTNDGDVAHALMHPRYVVEKMYRAYISKVFTDDDKKIFESGMDFDGTKTAACSVRFVSNNKRDVIIALHEGKNRQIHRMFGALGYSVQTLERVSYAGLDTKGLQQGEWRYLTEKEIESLRNHIHSADTL